MTLQPAAVVAPDVELYTAERLRNMLGARLEAYAANVSVGNDRAKLTNARKVVVRRDGGRQLGVFDYPRLGVRVWADKEQEASDLARLVHALLLDFPGDGTCVDSISLSGPSAVPDDSQPQKYLTVQLQLRCTPL